MVLTKADISNGSRPAGATKWLMEMALCGRESLGSCITACYPYPVTGFRAPWRCACPESVDFPPTIGYKVPQKHAPYRSAYF